MPILTLDKQQSIKKLESINANSVKNVERYNEIAETVENFQMVTLLSAAFWQAIKTGLSIEEVESKWTKLMEGDEYKNFLGQPLKHRGLNFVMAHLNYCLYIDDFQVRETDKGLRAMLNTESSQAASFKQVENKKLPYYTIAMNEFQLIKEYICINRVNYPESMWSKSSNPTKTSAFIIRPTKYRR